jgi:hypothetical protein
MITQVTLSTPVNYLYFSLNLPTDHIHQQTSFRIYLPSTIAPNNGSIETRLVCEWLIADQYARKYITAKHSICTFASPDIIVQSPFSGLLQKSASELITYLLKIR